MDALVGGEDRHLDGNAVGGLLREIFEVEMTAAVIVCGGCGMQGPIGVTMVYASPIGTVVRCGGCGQALIAITRVRGRWCVDSGGTADLRIVGGPG